MKQALSFETEKNERLVPEEKFKSICMTDLHYGKHYSRYPNLTPEQTQQSW